MTVAGGTWDCVFEVGIAQVRNLGFVLDVLRSISHSSVSPIYFLHSSRSLRVAMDCTDGEDFQQHYNYVDSCGWDYNLFNVPVIGSEPGSFQLQYGSNHSADNSQYDQFSVLFKKAMADVENQVKVGFERCSSCWGGLVRPFA